MAKRHREDEKRIRYKKRYEFLAQSHREDEKRKGMKKNR